MPKYKVTDNVTGRSYELTGDSPPTEQELTQIFEGSQKGSIMEGAPSGSIPLSSRAKLVEKDIRNRPDLLSRGGMGLAETILGAPKRPWEQTAQGLGSAALDIAGGAFQRPMAAIINPIIEIQKPTEMKSRSIPKQIGDAAASVMQGFTGERESSPFDVARMAGLTKGQSQLAEAASFGVSPENLAAGAARIGIGRGAAKIGKAIGKRTLPLASQIVHDIPDTLKKDILDTKALAFKGKEYFKDGKLGETVNELAEQVGKDFYAPAQKEWKNLGEKAAKIEVTPEYVTKMADDLQIKYADEIKGGRDEGIISDTIARLRKLGAPEEGLGLLGPTGQVLSGPVKPITLKDLLDAKATIRQNAGRSTAAMNAASDLSKKLADDFEMVQNANSRWQEYRQADEALRRAGIKTDPFEGEMGVQGAASKVSNYYDRRFPLAKDALEGGDTLRPSLLGVYTKSGKDATEAAKKIQEMKFAIQANMFSSKAPIGSAVAGRMIALPIGLALGGAGIGESTGLGGAPGALVGGGAGLLLSSPKAFSRLLRASLRDNPRKKFFDELTNRKNLEKGFDIGATTAWNAATSPSQQSE